MPNDILNTEVRTIDGKTTTLEEYKGKVLLVVNVASKCGLTPQYEQLENIHKAWEKDGFTVLGFPCNQFLGQEPGSEEEIKTFCSTTYGITFPMFSKIEVNGDGACELYQWLRGQTEGADISWNFEKFLINRDGTVAQRFNPMVTPEEIAPHVAELL